MRTIKQLFDKGEYLYFLLCLLYLFSPFTFGSHLFLLQESKMCETICFLGVYLVLVLAKSLFFEGKSCLQLSILDIIVACYAAYLSLLILFSWETVDRGILLGHVACGVLYVAARNIRKSYIPYLFLVFPVVLVWQSGYGIVKQTFCFFPGRGVDLICGSFLNTGIWGCFVSCVAVITCGILSLRFSRWIKLICVLVIVLAVLLLVAVNSRAAWLAFGGGCVYLLSGRLKNVSRRLKFVLLAACVSLLVLAGILTSGKVDSALGRQLIWKISGQMCADRPWGFGIDGFRRHYMNYQGDYFAAGGTAVEKTLASETVFAFNEPLRVVVELGIPGLLLLSLLLYVVFRKDKGVREYEFPCTRVIRATLLAWLIFSLFSYPASVFQTRALFILFLALFSSFQKTVTCISGKWIWISGSVLVWLVVFLEVFPYQRSLRAWEECTKEGNIPATYMDSLLVPLLNTPDFLSNASLLFNISGEAERAEFLSSRGIHLYGAYACCLEKGISLEKQGCDKEAEKCWIRAGYLVPNRFRPLYLRMEMHLKSGANEQARELGDSILKKEIKVRSPELFHMLERAEFVKYKFNTLHL